MITCAKVLHNKINSYAKPLGFSSLMKEQEQLIGKFIHGKDVFVCLLTSFGKSLGFIMLPDLIRAACNPSIVVAISPLNSLMSDLR